MLPGSTNSRSEDSAGNKNPFNEHHQGQPVYSQTSHAGPLSVEKISLAKFTVDAAVLGTGLLRPITFFPIKTTIISTDLNKYTVPDVPNGPHEAGLDTGIKRNKWADSSPAQVDRRYSELVELRALLAYQFPTMIVPPLPPKSAFENFGTFLTNENILHSQQHTLVRFLRELAMTPELMCFSVYIPNFFQLPRERFEDWIEMMRTTLGNFRRCNAAIDAHSTRKGGLLGSESVAAFTGGSTTVVRKFVGMLHSWMGGNGGGSGNASEQHEHRQASQTPSGRNRYANESDDIDYWTHEVSRLEKYREALIEASRPYLTFMEQSLEAVVASKEIAVALERFADILGASSENEDLAQLTTGASRFVGISATALDKKQVEEKGGVHERLLFEASYIDAALDAIDHVMCLWRHSDELSGGRAGAEFAAYTKDVSTKLRVFYEGQFLFNFSIRMRNMLDRMVKRELVFAKKVEDGIKETSFAKRIQQQDP